MSFFLFLGWGGWSEMFSRGSRCYTGMYSCIQG